jgi:signal transduction histidine kinase/ActR/RegA family two-component response regulator
MMFSSIRSRILATALVPVLAVVIVLVSMNAYIRLADVNEAYQQRSKLLVSQIAQSSEYGVFSGNLTHLQRASEAVLREPDVRAVTIFNADGAVLARAGASSFERWVDVPTTQRAGATTGDTIDTLTQPIVSDTVELIDDLFFTKNGVGLPQTQAIGHVVLEMSLDRLHAREREIVYVSLLIGLVGTFLGGLLAVRLGSDVMAPIARVSRRIRRIEVGDFINDDPDHSRDPLRELQMGLDQMANRLAWGRDELEQRVALVTEALRIKKDEAEAATLAKSRFLSAASHDLRQPTHALGLFVARLGQLHLDGQSRQLVGHIEASVQAMQNLLDGLLDLSRLESGAVAVHSGPVNVAEVFESLRSTLEPLALAKGLRLRVRTSAHWVQTDLVLFQRIIMNLAHNAIRYTDSGTVLLACRPAGGGKSVCVQVWDSGIGISPLHQTQIFTEFFQVGNSGRDRTLGLGLGLSIVERSARLLGHPLTMRSDLGCGTRFTMCMPVILAPVANLESTPLGEPSLLGLVGLRVLVVEDDAAACAAIESLLTGWGCKVSAVQTEVQARALMVNGVVPQVIVSDYRLGQGTNGLQVISALRNLAEHPIAACLMSGDSDANLLQAAKVAGLTVLHKPVRPAKLRAFLRRMAIAANIDNPITETGTAD